MSSWYTEVNNQNGYILKAIKKHPFIIQLMEGSLSKDVFEFYIHQDAMYLSAYKKILSQVAIKCNNTNDTHFFLDAAIGIINVENALHQTFLKDATIVNEMSPTCELYTSYLSSTVHNTSVAIGLAAVLPCFTIYKDIGDYILENQLNKNNNPYQDWINTYGGEAFANSVKKAIEITNAHAEKASKETIGLMNVAFNKASKLEWMFWDSAFNKEQWKL